MKDTGFKCLRENRGFRIEFRRGYSQQLSAVPAGLSTQAEFSRGLKGHTYSSSAE
jgi:hypothetical protein